MIYGRTYCDTGNKFFKKRKNVKNGYILTDPSPKTIQPAFPILKDHFSTHIQRSERGIEDLYSAKLPARLKVKALHKNISRIKSLNRQKRSKNMGVYRISKASSTKIPPPNINSKRPAPKIKQKKLPALLEKGTTPADYVIREFVNDPAEENVQEIRRAEAEREKEVRLRPRKDKDANTFNNNPSPIAKRTRKKTGSGIKWFPHTQKLYEWFKM